MPCARDGAILAILEPMDSSPPPATAAPTGVLDRVVFISGQVLFVVLVAVGTVRTLQLGDYVPGMWVLVTAVTGWNILGSLQVIGRGPRAQRIWLAGLLLGWAGLVAVGAEFVWLAFLLAMLVWHLLPRRWAAPTVLVIMVVAVVGFAWHRGGLQVAAVIGPVIGIASAVVFTELYARISAQSEERRRLLDELLRTQRALAVREREAGRLAERERLAGDIHDTVGQALASVILLLRAAGSDTATPAARATQLDTALSTAQTALAETRRLVRGLVPESIEKHGLRRSLQALAEESTALGIATSYAEHGFAGATPALLPTATEESLLRAAQEAVANARNHGAPTHVAITVTRLADAVTVDVIDDGSGFDPTGAAAAPQRPDGSGYGLRAMHSRISACDGSVVIESEPGQGTAVQVTVPIEEEQ